MNWFKGNWQFLTICFLIMFAMFFVVYSLTVRNEETRRDCNNKVTARAIVNWDEKNDLYIDCVRMHGLGD